MFCAISRNVGQELSTVDKTRGHYYILGYNATSYKPNLYGWNLKTHEVVVDLELPFTESGFVVCIGLIAASMPHCMRVCSRFWLLLVGCWPSH